MSDGHWHLLSYDIRDDKRRRRVHRHLAGWGDRVQFSVFRVHCGPRHLIRLRWELARLMDTDDSLLVVPIPDAVARRIQTLHEQIDWTEDAQATYAIIGSARTAPHVPAAQPTP